MASVMGRDEQGEAERATMQAERTAANRKSKQK